MKQHMNAQLITCMDKPIIECLPDGIPLRTETDILGLIGFCGEHLCGSVLVHAGVLPDEFYDLKTGLAGELLQKLVNYRITAAFIVEAEKAGSGRFYEMMIEANRGRQFFFCQEREQAVAWLEKNSVN
jgi:hypothetical protein